MIGLLIAIGAIYPLFRAFDKADSGKSRGEKARKKGIHTIDARLYSNETKCSSLLVFLLLRYYGFFHFARDPTLGVYGLGCEYDDVAEHNPKQK